MSNMRQGLYQRLQQKLSPQQIQLMKLLQIPVATLEQRVKEELQENPALEEGRENGEEEYPVKEEEEIKETEDDEEISEREEEVSLDEYLDPDEVPDYKTSSNNTSPDEERREIPLSAAGSFQDQLLAQLYQLDLDSWQEPQVQDDPLLQNRQAPQAQDDPHLQEISTQQEEQAEHESPALVAELNGSPVEDEPVLSDHDRRYHIAEQLVGSLDDDGYLRRDLNALVDDLAFSQNIHSTVGEIEYILKQIQTLEPLGIGARSLQECLLIQLAKKDQAKPSVILAKKILEDYMDEFSRKHYEKIEEQMKITEDELKAATKEILKLNPRPGSTAYEGQRSAQHIIPDFILSNNNGTLELILNSRNAPELKVSHDYKEMLHHYSKDKKNKESREAISFVKQKLDAAKWFIDAMKQRQHTLMEVMRTIMEFQYEYFLEGDQTKMKKMVLRDIAEKIGMDISTVSRVANSKYVQTHFGTYLLKTFFSEGLQTESGEEVSSKEVKQILTDAIKDEDKRHPITDEALTKILREKGYTIARRTVAKYREMLDIPVARLRKELL